MDIEELKRKIRNEEYDLTVHALKRRLERNISTEEIENTIMNGKIIEEYLDDYPFPSCLISGFIKEKESIHIVCALAPRIKIITVYKPEEDEWINFKKRRFKK